MLTDMPLHRFHIQSGNIAQSHLMMLITVDLTDCIQTLDCCAPPTGTQSIHSIVLLVERKQSKCKYNLRYFAI